MSDGPGLTHFDSSGASHMVDVGGKAESERSATAEAIVTMNESTFSMIREMKFAKGNVFEVARLAGIMAAKRTPDLIPLCHPLPISAVNVNFEILDRQKLQIRATVKVFSRTGVEMEALVAVNIAALTVYDMVKSADRGVTIGPVRLIAKSGGRSGNWTAGENP